MYTVLSVPISPLLLSSPYFLSLLPLPLSSPLLPHLLSLPSSSKGRTVGVGCIPGASKDIKRLGEHIVVDETRVDGEETHQEHNVAAIEDGHKHLEGGRREEGGERREKGEEGGERRVGRGGRREGERRKG